LAAARGVSIATTLDWMHEATSDRQIQVARDNIASMRRAGNTIVIGTDQFRKTARAEAELILSRHLMSNLELLQAWSVATPRAIFPQRKIGRLSEGFEASFLVLGGDPLADGANMQKIVMWVKQGHTFIPGDTKLPKEVMKCMHVLAAITFAASFGFTTPTPAMAQASAVAGIYGALGANLKGVRRRIL
jgi:hypothetical protein